MLITIDDVKFESAHRAFKQYILERSQGVPFANFRHQFLRDDEIDYKRRAYYDAKPVLRLDQWASWVKTPGHILRAVQKACVSAVSENLLQHKYGLENSSEGALYKVSTPAEISGLEGQLVSFFQGGSNRPGDFGPRYDALAQYLRDNQLGCNWRFLAYLAFLVNADSYFPVVPSKLDSVLEYYGVNRKISGYVSWERYALVLEVAEVLKDKLEPMVESRPDAVEIQSYMWVVAHLIEQQRICLSTNMLPEPDFDSELKTRTYSAARREKIGLLGEQLVYDIEKRRLTDAGRTDLADKIRVVSATDYTGQDSGYDILSYTVDGHEIHIEVKSTVSSQTHDSGFWLSDNEKKLAEQDERWQIYRVWSIDTMPVCLNLGNIVRDSPTEWSLTISNWFVNRKTA